MPAELKMLMRHADVETTMKYYVDIDSDHISAELWARFSEHKSTIMNQGTSALSRLDIGVRWAFLPVKTQSDKNVQPTF